jgi:hypothetical protein
MERTFSSIEAHEAPFVGDRQKHGTRSDIRTPLRKYAAHDLLDLGRKGGTSVGGGSIGAEGRGVLAEASEAYRGRPRSNDPRP